MTEAGARQLADAALYACGGGGVQLRIAAPAAGGEDAEQLGLATPVFQEIELGPALLRRSASPRQLLIAASAVVAAVGSLGCDSAAVLFETAVGVVVGGELFPITGSVAMLAEGRPYAYTLTLQAPVA